MLRQISPQHHEPDKPGNFPGDIADNIARRRHADCSEQFAAVCWGQPAKTAKTHGDMAAQTPDRAQRITTKCRRVGYAEIVFPAQMPVAQLPPREPASIAVNAATSSGGAHNMSAFRSVMNVIIEAQLIVTALHLSSR